MILHSFCLFFSEKLELALCLGAKAAKSILGAFTHAPVAMVLGVCANTRTYLQLDAHSATSSSLFIILFRYTLFQTCFCSGALKEARWTFEHERRSEGAFVLIRTLLGGKHASSLDAWPLALCGQDGMYERSERMETCRWASPTAKAAGTPSEYWMIRALGKPHYTFRGILFSLYPDSWTAKLFWRSTV